MCTLLQSNIATTKIMIKTSVLLDDFQWKLFSNLACWITRKQYQRASLLFSRGVVGSFAPLFAKTNVGCFLGISLAASCLPPPNQTHTCKTRVYIHIYITWFLMVSKKMGHTPKMKLQTIPHHTTSKRVYIVLRDPSSDQKGNRLSSAHVAGTVAGLILLAWN